MAVTKSLVFITCLCFARDFVFCDDYEEIGKDITLTPIIRGKPTEILWKHNENMVLLYDGREVVVYGSFTRRVVVDFETGQLTIRKLTSRDSGQYQSEIVINGKVQTSSHTVTVLDVLPEPKVTCEPDETSNVKKLLCSVDSRTQPSYEWSGLDIKVHSGPELLVEEQEEHRDLVYTCTVKNQANSKSTDFTLRDCHTGRAATAVFVPVIILIIILIILLILLGIFLYRRKEKSRQSGLKKMDLESGEGHSLLRNSQKDGMPGSSEATLPSHARLPAQNQSIMDKKWDQDNGAESSGETDEGHKLLKETKKLQEHNLKQSPQSAVSETNQEDTGNEGELDKNVKNSKNAVEAEENTYSKPDETEKERHKQRQEEEEKEKSQKQESRNEEKFPEHQNERGEQKTEDNREDDQTPGEKEETRDRPDTETVSPQSAVTERNNMDTENEAEQRHKHEKKSQSDEGEQSAEQKNESMRNQKTKDDVRPGEKEEEKQDTAGACDHPAVDQPLDAEALSSPAVTDSPINLEKKLINSSDSSSNQTDQDQEEEEVRKPSGSELDEEETGVTNQEQEDGQEQMAEGKNPEISEEQNCINADKQTDPDSAMNSASQRQLDDELSREKEVQTKNLKQSPQSAVSETNQEDTGNEGELDKNVKNSKNAVEAEENTYSKPDETEKERHKQRQEEEEKEKSQKQESRNEEKFPEHQNERGEQKTEDNREDDQTPGEKEETRDRPDTETVSPQSAVTERNNMDTENEAEQRHKHEKKSQSDEGEQSAEQKNESMRNQKTKDDVRPGEKEEEKQDTAGACDHPAVDQPLDAEALSSPAVTDSPINLEKKLINSSDSSSNQTDQDQEEEEVRKPSGSELDEEETGVTNQEQEDGQEQMAEGKNPEICEEQNCINADKQTDPDSAMNSASQRQLDDELRKQDEEVPNKSKITAKGQSFKLVDNNTKVMQNEGETEVQTQAEDSGQRDVSSEPEQDTEEDNDPPEMSQHV